MKHLPSLTKIVAAAILLLATCNLAQAAHVYRGNSTYSSDIVCTTDGHIPVPLLMLIL